MPRTAPRKYVDASNIAAAARLREHYAELRKRRERLDERLRELDDDTARAIEDGRALNLSMDSIAAQLGTTRTTLYRCLRRAA